MVLVLPDGLGPYESVPKQRDIAGTLFAIKKSDRGKARHNLPYLTTLFINLENHFMRGEVE
ncbi:MAG: hypothetical protein GTO42_08235 [Candidatus Latescibacteria bacterium]|nr:hypothetical protein [Candidatus Latescibacterota bacterium]NIO02114.1 hypothetical protein [Candidatus Latescibacterota bacterium]NIO28931.1 hypothetical protein [Candidatus Latescibacterota bacterium]NIO56556.1 hypothetical protein [Candidatus Latescibacterota bacterium]NIT02146.1 hypothetical protein [Candidatus Latescibacterota bacterium]